MREVWCFLGRIASGVHTAHQMPGELAEKVGTGSQDSKKPQPSNAMVLFVPHFCVFESPQLFQIEYQEKMIGKGYQKFDLVQS